METQFAWSELGKPFFSNSAAPVVALALVFTPLESGAWTIDAEVFPATGTFPRHLGLWRGDDRLSATPEVTGRGLLRYRATAPIREGVTETWTLRLATDRSIDTQGVLWARIDAAPTVPGGVVKGSPIHGGPVIRPG